MGPGLDDFRKPLHFPLISLLRGKWSPRSQNQVEEDSNYSTPSAAGIMRSVHRDGPWGGSCVNVMALEFLWGGSSKCSEQKSVSPSHEIFRKFMTMWQSWVPGSKEKTYLSAINLNHFCGTSSGVLCAHSCRRSMGPEGFRRSRVSWKTPQRWLTAQGECGRHLMQLGCGRFFDFVIYFKRYTEHNIKVANGLFI